MKKVITIILFAVFLTSCKNDKKEIKNEASRIEAKKLDGKYHGKFEEYDKFGNKVVDGYMQKGNKIGLWKYYNENRTIEKARNYLNDTTFVVLEAKDYKYEEVFFDKIKCYLAIPSSWEKQIEFENPNILISAVKSNSGDTFNSNIVMSYEKLGNLTPEQYVANNKATLEREYENFNEVSFKKSKVSKFESYELQFATNVNGVDISGITVWSKVNDNIVTFTGSCITEDISKYIFLFKETAYSLTKAK